MYIAWPVNRAGNYLVTFQVEFGLGEYGYSVSGRDPHALPTTEAQVQAAGLLPG